MIGLIKRIIGAVLLGVPLCLILTGISIWNYSGICQKENADVVIVLGAGLDGNEISNVFKERVNHAIQLYENGFAPKIIITGGVGKGSRMADSAMAKKYAVSLGVNPDDIITEEQSTITLENIKFSKAIMDDCGFKSAIIVSDPLHMKRSMKMCEDYDIEAFSWPTQTSAYKSIGTRLWFVARESILYIGYIALQ